MMIQKRISRLRLWVFRGVLLGLAMAPLASVSLAAESKLSELEGEQQADELRKALREAYGSLFPEGLVQVSVRTAYDRFIEVRGLPGGELSTDDAFMNTLLLLESHGILQINEKMLSGGPPSGEGYEK